MPMSQIPVNPSVQRSEARTRRRAKRKKNGVNLFIGKHFLFFVVLLIIILILNATLYFFISIIVLTNNNSEMPAPNALSMKISEGFAREDSEITLQDPLESELANSNIWAFLINSHSEVIWTSKNMPSGARLPKNAKELALMAHYGKLESQPIFIYTPYENTIMLSRELESLEYAEQSLHSIPNSTLLVLVYPNDSYAVFPTTSLASESITIIVASIFIILFVDMAIFFISYLISRRSIIKNFKPISEGLNRLSRGEAVNVEVGGELIELADDLNAASEIIRAKDHARANWISGVSHDIRTPLSMVMGYADRIAENPEVPGRVRTEASIIRSSSIKMKDLIEDLNLVSKLDYDMQPLRRTNFSPAALTRTTLAEFIDASDPELYEFDLDIDPRCASLKIQGDERLLTRALRNLLQNAITHNAEGCSIKITCGICDASHLNFPPPHHLIAHNLPYASPRTNGFPTPPTALNSQTGWFIQVKDNGKGVNAIDLVSLQNGPCSLADAASRHGDGFATHGLGLILVRNVTQIHGGVLLFESKGVGCGLTVTMVFPLS